MSPLPRIAVFAGPTATICNTADLVTSNQARRRHGLPLLVGADDAPLRHDILRAQRLAAPVTVYVDAQSAHPLEDDAADLYADADGWLDGDGTFSTSAPPEGGGRPVYVAELRPEDGLYLLPYLARQADGSAWEATTAHDFAPVSRSRQTFYPDASRLYEEIDRFGLTDFGGRVGLFSVAGFDFFRAGPSGGYQRNGEQLGTDFFGYYPSHLGREPTLAVLAELTNLVQSTLDSGAYLGAQWLEGSPTIEETLYWLGLLIDTRLPIVGHSAQRRHHTSSADGARNILDGVKYLLSGAALDESGTDRIGPVLIVDELIYSAREVTKVDARPGGYEVIGGHGGIVADLGGYGQPRVTFGPRRRHTHCSDVRLSALPHQVEGVDLGAGGAITRRPIQVKQDGRLCADAIPSVSVHKFTRFVYRSSTPDGPASADDEVELLARLEWNLRHAPLGGVVIEGMSPFGAATPTIDAALRLTTFSGYPVVRVGRGNTGGMAYRHDPVFIVGSNLSSTKARMLLMACLLRVGALPIAENPARPTNEERANTIEAITQYQQIFDTH